MSDLTLDEIVSLMEHTLDDAAVLDLHPVFVSGLSALIADWRKRGEALKPFSDFIENTDSAWSDERRIATLNYDFDKLRLGIFRAARAALTPQQPPEAP